MKLRPTPTETKTPDHLTTVVNCKLVFEIFEFENSELNNLDYGFLLPIATQPNKQKLLTVVIFLFYL
jgi:hypothetical protein